MKRFVIALSLLLPLGLFAYTSPGVPAGYVNDFAEMLSPEARTQLESALAAYEKETGNEIVVVTVPTYGDDEVIETYAATLFEEWGIGKAKEDNGLLLLVARDDREMRIEVGYGLEPVVTDIESSHIINDVMVPEFRNNNFDAGITKAVEIIIEAIGGEVTSESRAGPGRTVDIGAFFYPALFFIVVLGSILGKSKSWWAGGIIGVGLGVLVGIFMTITAGFIAAAILGLLGLLFDFIVSKSHAHHRNGGPTPPWWMGGGGHGGGGGGFGGFGGGMSGGGGSSGRW